MKEQAIDRDSPVPIYYQLKQILSAKIDGGAWPIGTALPGEHELQETYGVSRTTVRQALGELTHEGRLVRHRGRGTFVCPPLERNDPDRHLSMSELLRLQGVSLSWQVLDRDWVAADDDVAEELGVAPGDRVYRIRRLRQADGAPLGLHEMFVPADIAEKINVAGLLASESLRYLRDVPDMAHSLAFRSIVARPAGEEECRLLEIDPGTPLLVIERTTVSEEHRPLEFLRAAYPGDRFRYQVTV